MMMMMMMLSRDRRSFEFTVNRLFMKIFRTGSPAIVRECQQNFDFLPIESQLEIRTAKFLQAFSATKNTLCLLFKQRAVTQLDGIFLANTNQTSFVVLVSWHVHYVVNIEQICSNCILFAPCSYVFVFDFDVRLSFLLFCYCYQLSGE